MKYSIKKINEKFEGNFVEKINDLKDYTLDAAYKNKVTLKKEITLSKKDYYEMTENLLRNYDFINNELGLRITDGKNSFIIFTEGYSYARSICLEK